MLSFLSMLLSVCNYGRGTCAQQVHTSPQYNNRTPGQFVVHTKCRSGVLGTLLVHGSVVPFFTRPELNECIVQASACVLISYFSSNRAFPNINLWYNYVLTSRDLCKIHSLWYLVLKSTNWRSELGSLDHYYSIV